MDIFLTRQAAANLLSVSTAALRSWHYRGGGPPMVKIGRLCRYEESKLLAWGFPQSKQAHPPANARPPNGGGKRLF